MAITHEFAWSVSRAGNFAQCKRRYYNDYYLSWLGWQELGDPDRRRAYLLKKMTRMPMFAGNCLHDALAGWFGARRQGRELAPEEVVKAAVESLRQGYRESRDGLWRRRPAKLCHLAEHHFEEEVIDEASGNAGEYGQRYLQRIETGVANFFGLEELAPVRQADPASYLACEELGTIELFGTKIYAVPDFAFAVAGADGRRTWIYDWKTGTPREADAFQLALYALYAEAVWGDDPETVTCVDAYLTSGELVERRYSRAELDQVLGRVEASIRAMRDLHFDADRGAGDPEAFPQIPLGDPAAGTCARCNYRELCER